MPAPAVGPQSSRLHRYLPGDAEGNVPSAAGGNAGALQAADRGRHPVLHRLRRMAQQGWRLCGAGHRRFVRGETGRLLLECRRAAAV